MTRENYWERLIVVFSVACILLLAGYLYLVNTSVFAIVARKQAESKISDLESQVATLEARYIVLSGRLTLDYAHELGFHDLANDTVRYARSGGGAVSLSSAANEI